MASIFLSKTPNFTINQGLTEHKVKSFAQSYPQPANP